MEPSWVGRRVSVRRVVEDESGAGRRQGDVVGDLVGLDAQTAVVETRKGLVEIAVPSVVIARLVPASTADELSLDAVIARGLRPAETAELDGWALRADPDATLRANSVLALGQLRRPLTEALDEARSWYAERGLPLTLYVQTEARRLLDAELGERGWRPSVDSHVLIARLDRLDAPAGAHPTVSIAASPNDAWLGRYPTEQAAIDPTRALLTRHDSVAFASVLIDGCTVAIGRAVVDDDWLGITALQVDPQFLRQGLGTAVVARLCEWGRAQGARRSYAQVTADNDAGLGLYATLGYWPHHDFRYREDPLGLEG